MKTSIVQSLVLSSVSLVAAAPSTNAHSKRQEKAGAFYLAGDSTTAGGDNAGGWGDGFLDTLVEGSIGTNYGHSGATTASFFDGGDWASVIESVTGSAEEYDTYVTIQFGHNDQKEDSGVSIEQFQANLEQMVDEVNSAGGTPILATSLSRRNFDDSTGEISLDLEDVVEAAKAAAAASNATYIDLNAASMDYLNAIGEENAMTYNLTPDDNTHLNTAGNILFGNMVSWLLTTGETVPAEQAAFFQAYTAPQDDIAAAFESGEYILPE